MAYDHESTNENWRVRVRICGPASVVNVKDNTTYCYPNRNTWNDCLFQMRLFDINPRKWRVEGLRNRDIPPRSELHEPVSWLLRKYHHRLGPDVPHRVFLVPKEPGESFPTPGTGEREAMLHRHLRSGSRRLVAPTQQSESSATAQMCNTERQPTRGPVSRPEPIVITLDDDDDPTPNSQAGPSTSRDSATENNLSGNPYSLQKLQTPPRIGSTSVEYTKRLSKKYAPGSAFRPRDQANEAGVSGERPRVQAPVPIRPPQQAPVPTRPPQQAPVSIRPPQQAPVPIRPPQLAPVPIRPPQLAPVPIRPPQQAPVCNKPHPLAPVLIRPSPVRWVPVQLQPPRPPPVQFKPKTLPQPQPDPTCARHGNSVLPPSMGLNHENGRLKTFPELGVAIVTGKLPPGGRIPPFTATNASSFGNNLNPSSSQSVHRPRRSPTYRPHTVNLKKPPPPQSQAPGFVQHPKLQNTSNWSNYNEGTTPQQQDIQPLTHYRVGRFLARLSNYMEQHQRSRYHLADLASHQATSVTTGIEAHGSQQPTDAQHHQSLTSQIQPPVPPHHQQEPHFPSVQNMGHDQVHPQPLEEQRPQNPPEVLADPRPRSPNFNSFGQQFNQYVRRMLSNPNLSPQPPPEEAHDSSSDDEQHDYHP